MNTSSSGSNIKRFAVGSTWKPCPSQPHVVECKAPSARNTVWLVTSESFPRGKSPLTPETQYVSYARRVICSCGTTLVLKHILGSVRAAVKTNG